MTKPLNRFEKNLARLNAQLPNEIRQLNYKSHWKKPNPKQVFKMKNDQDGYCAICYNLLPDNVKHIHVDHCHEYLQTRGVLCVNCNIGLGHFKDDVIVLRNAADYLEKWRSIHSKVKRNGQPS